MKCPRGPHENTTQATFCLECGVRLAPRCSQCGTELPAGAKFCLECGQAVSGPTAEKARLSSPESYTPEHLAEKILASKSALEGERKQVTVYRRTGQHEQAQGHLTTATTMYREMGMSYWLEKTTQEFETT